MHDFRYCCNKRKMIYRGRKYSFSINEWYDIFRKHISSCKERKNWFANEFTGIHTFQIRISRFQLFRIRYRSMHPCGCSDISSSAKCRNCWNNDREFRACSTVGKKKWWIDRKLKSFGIKALVCKPILFFGLSLVRAEEEELALS